MKFFIPLLILLWTTLLSTAQSLCDTRASKKLCEASIKDLFKNRADRKLLVDSWCDFEGMDLERRFPAADGLHVLPLRFDAIGCVYPEFIDDNRLKAAFLDDPIAYGVLRRFSFYSLMRNYPKSLEKHYPQLNGRLDELKKLARAPIYGIPSETEHAFKFRDMWNALFFPEVQARANAMIAANHIKHCVYFIPGYNVPYSLAQLHGNNVFRDYIAALPAGARKENILFVRVFWPTNSMKKKRFGGTACNMDNKLVLRNQRLYSYITNRAYCAGISLRQFIKSLPGDVTMALVSHSFGATLNSTAVLTPQQKMVDTTGERNQRFIQAYRAETPPAQRCYLFLSAPGIPGMNNFRPFDKTQNKQHFFYIGYNNKDRILRKQPLNWINVSWSEATDGCSTTLGCDWEGEISKVKRLVNDTLQAGTQFAFCHNSNLPVNDDCCYRRQPEFRQNFAQFVQESWVKADTVTSRQ